MTKEQMAVLKQLQHIPRAELGCWPTPVQRMNRMEQALQAAPVYIKRDDMNGLGPGGNKVRSLEYLLAAAQLEGADTVIASGPAQSNLCTLAACGARKLGMQPILVHNGARPERLEGNALLNQLCGAQSHYIGAGTDEYQRAERVAELEETLRQTGSHPYTVLKGASTGLGAVGYIHVIAELLNQREREGLDIQHLFVPGGNGGVAAGIVYGNAILGGPFTVHVISVEYAHDDLKAEMERIIAEMEPITHIPLKDDIDTICDLQDAYMGAGWGQNTPESAAMVEEFPRWEGIYIENVYNSKVVVAMVDYLCSGKLTGGACYLHTGGFGSLFAQY